MEVCCSLRSFTTAVNGCVETRGINVFVPSARSTSNRESDGTVVSFCKVSAERQEAFDRLKSALLEAPVLRLADVSSSFGGHTDASNNTLAAVLLQSDPDDPEDYHPISYLSRKLSSAEKNFTYRIMYELAVCSDGMTEAQPRSFRQNRPASEYII